MSAPTFGYLDYFAWHRVFRWLVKRHAELGRMALVRRLLPDWKLAAGGTTLFNPQKVSIILYRYRGRRIPTPWAPLA